MKKILIATALLVQACSVSTPDVPSGKYRDYDVKISSGEGAKCNESSPSTVATALAHANSVRASRGLSPLSPSAKLNKIAAQQACTMARTGTMTHAGPGEGGPKDRAKAVGYQPRVIAENIAAGRYDANQASAQWSASSAHLANITIPQVRDFGIGSAIGGDGTVYWSGVYAAHK